MQPRIQPEFYFQDEQRFVSLSASAENHSVVGSAASEIPAISNVSVSALAIISNLSSEFPINEFSDEFIVGRFLDEKSTQSQSSAVIAAGETGISVAFSASGNLNPAPTILEQPSANLASTFVIGSPVPTNRPMPPEI